MTQIGKRYGAKVSGTIYNKTLTSAVTSLTITGLDGNADGGYEFEFYIYEPGVGYQPYAINFNGDTTITNYFKTFIYVANGTPLTGTYANDYYFFNAANAISKHCITGKIYVVDGVIFLHAFQVGTTNAMQTNTSLYTTATGTNITSLSITSIGAANGIGVNSRFRLWRKL